jgi:type I restriction enzyme S subunit
LRNHPLPIPPLAEQHRIVAKIEELFSELDQGVASLKTAREQLKVYRQSLLKIAFEGKLTAAVAWRENTSRPTPWLSDFRFSWLGRLLR